MINKKIQILFIFIVILTITAMAITGCIFNKEEPENLPSENKIETPQEDGAVNDEEENIEIVEDEQEEEYLPNEGVFPGDRAPDFSLLDREGNEIKLSDLKGKIVYLNFWATWRGLSTYEMPFIQEAYEKYKEEDVVVMAVNVLAAEQKNMEELNDYIDEKGYTLPVLFDVEGATMKQYKVSGFPTTFIIDKEGIIADFVSGAMEREIIMEKIEKVLEKY